MDDLDLLHAQAEPIGHHLRKRRFVALAVRVRAGEYRHRAGRVDAHLARFKKSGARAEAARDIRRRDAAGLDIARVAEAPELAAAQGLLAPVLEARDIGELQHRTQRRLVVAGVVAQRHRRLVRKLGDEVAPPQLDRIELDLARRRFNEPLDHVGGFGAAGAAIGIDRHRVGEHRRHLAVDRRRLVLAGEQRGVEDRRDARGERGEVRAQVRRGAHAHRQELAVLVQRELGGGDMVAAVRIGDEGLRAVGVPLHRPAELARGPGDDHVLRVEVDLGAKAAAHIRGDHSHLALRQAEHECGHQQALDMRVLARDVQRVAVIGARVARIRRARLDGVGHQAVVHEVELGDMRGACEGGVDRAPVADRPDIAGVVRRNLMQRRAALRLRGVDHGGKRLVIHFDQLGRIARLRLRFGDHDCDALADVAHLALRERRIGRLLHRLALDVGDQPAAGQAADLGGGEVRAGVDGDDAGRLLGLFCLDGAQHRMGMRRAYECGVGLSGERYIIGVLAGAGKKAIVLFAGNACSDQRAGHGCLPFSFRYLVAAMARAPAMMLFTML